MELNFVEGLIVMIGCAAIVYGAYRGSKYLQAKRDSKKLNVKGGGTKGPLPK